MPVATSYEKINYSLRPAKSVERKMLVEAFRRLSMLASLSSYRYIGFGSTYFSDFVLFHKALSIHNMISIEKDIANRTRFEFNKPFRCIQMELGNSNTVLPTLPWQTRSIVWLDYDHKLDANMLADVRFLCSSVPSDSVILFTVNAQPDKYDEAHPRLPQLSTRVGEEKVPHGVVEKDLDGWGQAAVSRRLITNEIRETLSARNGALAFANHFLYKQLFYFCYSDGAKMVTAGGLLYERGRSASVASCEFDSLKFVRVDQRAGCKPFMIEIPSLTYKEIRHVNTQLPRTTGSRLTSPKVPNKDLKRYELIYRHFPQFAETEI